MDFVEGLPKSQGFSSILVVVDRLSKYAHFIPLVHPFTAQSVARVFMQTVVRLHGLPRTIVTDRDRIFTSNFWKELFKMLGTELSASSSYHPQTDGQTEVTNRTLEQYLRCFSQSNPHTWADRIAWAEYWYNTSYHQSLGRTPFEAVYGRTPPTLVSYSPNQSSMDSVDQLIVERDELLNELKAHLLKAQTRMKNYYDQGRKDKQFQEGDMVYVKLRPRRQKSVTLAAKMKLGYRYYGPYKILKKIGSVAYKLDLPADTRVHPVFHVSQLKAKVGHLTNVVHDLPELNEDTTLLVQPLRVLDYRVIKKNRKQIPEALVQWENMAPEEATWESTEYLAYQFPHLHLEDKMLPKGRGMLRPQVAAMDVEVPTAPALGSNLPHEAATAQHLLQPSMLTIEASPTKAALLPQARATKAVSSEAARKMKAAAPAPTATQGNAAPATAAQGNTAQGRASLIAAAATQGSATPTAARAAATQGHATALQGHAGTTASPDVQQSAPLLGSLGTINP